MSYNCNVCRQEITQSEYVYSKNNFRGVPLCRYHQEIERKKGNQLKAAGTKSLDEVIFNSRVLENSNSGSVQNELKLEVLLKDSRAIRIVKGIPIESRNEVVEKYIILGEMVASHASISTNKETVAEFFSPLTNDINMIREQLKIIVPTMAAPAAKGKMTVDTVFESLKEHFMDDSFEDVSKIGKFADILATTADSEIPILIELKDYCNTVPIAEVEKFWRDIERRGTKYGIFISMRTGIAKCSSCISVKTEMNKTAVFINNSELNWSGHLFAYYVIKKIAELESTKRKEFNGQEIGQVLAKVNKHILDLQRDVVSIDKIEDVADSLRSICKKKLDELINVSDALKRNMNDGVEAIIADLETVET